METLIHADIFFFIASVFFIVIGLGLVVFILYGLLVVRELRELVRMLKREGAAWLEDAEKIRTEIKNSSQGTRGWLDWLLRLRRARRTRRRKNTSQT